MLYTGIFDPIRILINIKHRGSGVNLLIQDIKKPAMLSFAAVLTMLFFFPFIANADTVEGPIARTNYGDIQGLTKNNTEQWKGVPYGGSVSGDKRWKKPTAPTPWQGVKQTTVSAKAIQNNGGTANGTEDGALTLDIWRPQNSSKNLPVMVYVHGGNNQSGSSSDISGASIAATHNVVFVSINHRLGALGYNPLPALKDGDPENDSGNYGLLDIHQSLTWVQQNIGNFGGNGHNITLSGFSSGGRDVMATLISPIFRGQFQHAVVFSGGMTTSKVAPSQKRFAQLFAPLVVQDKVKPNLPSAENWLLTKDPAVKKYFYNLSAERIETAIGDASIRMDGFPHLYRDGYVLPKNGYDTYRYNNVPVILFTGTHEFSSFGSWDPYFSDSFNDGSIYTDPNKKAQFGFIKKYGGQLYSSFNVEDSADQMLLHGYRAPIYGMRMNFGDDPAVVGDKMGFLGAYHGVFTGLLDRYQNPYDGAYKTPGATQLASIFQIYLSNFMRGVPFNAPYQEKLWLPYNLSHQTLHLDASQTKASSWMERKNYSYRSVLREIKSDHSLPAQTKDYLLKNVMNNRWFSHQLDRAYHNETWFERDNNSN